MAKYAAVCNAWPELSIGDSIQFHAGSFETDDPEVWAKLQANPAWGVQIHPRDLPDADAGVSAEPVAESSHDVHEEPSEESSEPRVRRGSRGSR